MPASDDAPRTASRPLLGNPQQMQEQFKEVGVGLDRLSVALADQRDQRRRLRGREDATDLLATADRSMQLAVEYLSTAEAAFSAALAETTTEENN